ncbi:Uu.00g062220.m01.CDS01 [Anthostomella pinea]|uniref:Uu.00g062220.m01.CDS01 n=1 Tax=Anthostomella pinea TaxID=933095 RepID=A0AAI8VT50_9PEZI|nr:Uu.00g062220.m01.CDS01 [Anthostomella pinea]
MLFRLNQLAHLGAVTLGLVSAHPLVQTNLRGFDVIPNHYIITLKDDITTHSLQVHMDWVQSLSGNDSPMEGIRKQWNIGSWRAYSGSFDDETLAQIRTHDAVEAIESSTLVRTMEEITEYNATWGLESISHRDRAYDDNDHDYVYDSSAGNGTYAYIIDTGVRTTHDEFEGRATKGADGINEDIAGDLCGHGTHVAGTLAGKTYGVAKKASIISVNVFGGYCHIGVPTEVILAGYQWAVDNITATGREQVSVISMSLGGRERSHAKNRAIKAAWQLGILTVVAAGNDGRDAAYYSPASVAEAVTVAAITYNDARAPFSNWGGSVDIFAPGVDIKSAGNSNDTATLIKSGTSMSTPHISGLVLYLKSLMPTLTDTPEATVNFLKALATKGVVENARRAPNLLGFNGHGVLKL